MDRWKTMHSTTSSNPIEPGVKRRGRLCLLAFALLHSLNPDGSHRTTIVSNCRHPGDSLIDVDAGHIYIGSIRRDDLNGENEHNILYSQRNLAGVTCAEV